MHIIASVRNVTDLSKVCTHTHANTFHDNSKLQLQVILDEMKRSATFKTPATILTSCVLSPVLSLICALYMNVKAGRPLLDEE